MNLCRKNTGAYLNQTAVITCPDYSEIIDVDIYKGGYNDLYYEVHYTCRDNTQPHTKIIHLLYLTHELEGQYLNLDINYTFYKVVDGGGINRIKYFIYKYEQLSIQEERDSKLSTMI